MVKKYREFLYLNKKKEVKINVDEYARAFPSKMKAQAELQGLIERGGSLLFIYTGGVPDYYNYKTQFKDMFNFVEMHDNLQVEYFKEMTHTFSRVDDRTRLMNCVCDWMQRNYR
jgi:hypothetical protein